MLHLTLLGAAPIPNSCCDADGAGFESKLHLANAYDVGKSHGQGKRDGFNYGQGEKAGGLKVRLAMLLPCFVCWY